MNIDHQESLEAEVARLNRVADNLVIAADVEKEKREAAEREAARLREGLREIERAVDREWTKQLDAADAYDDEGAHVGLARHARARAEGLAHAHSIITIETRALLVEDGAA